MGESGLLGFCELGDGTSLWTLSLWGEESESSVFTYSREL